MPKKTVDCPLEPLTDHCVIEADEAADYVGSIAIPDTAKEKPKRGKVLAVGPGLRDKNGEQWPPGVRAGETVIFIRYDAGQEVQLNGATYLIVSERDIVARVRGQ